MARINFKKQILFILILFLLIIILFFSYQMSTFLVPVFVAFFTAMFLQPFINRLHATRLPNKFSTAIVYLFFILTIGTIITILTLSFGSFISDLPDLTVEFRNKVIEIVEKILQLEIIRNNVSQAEVTEMIKQILTLENLNTFVITPVNVTLGILKSFGLYALSLIFIIPFIKNLSEKIFHAFPGESGQRINQVYMNINQAIQSYMITKSLISFIVGSLSLIVCLIFQVKYALLWGAIIFIFNFIPVIGSIIAVIFPILLSVIQYHSPLHFFTLSLILITLQLVMGNIIEPKFMSKSVNLSPLVIFISLMVWGYIWGIAGVILSVPIMSALNLVCKNIKSLQPLSVLLSATTKTTHPAPSKTA